VVGFPPLPPYSASPKGHSPPPPPPPPQAEPAQPPGYNYSRSMVQQGAANQVRLREEFAQSMMTHHTTTSSLYVGQAEPIHPQFAVRTPHAGAGHAVLSGNAIGRTSSARHVAAHTAAYFEQARHYQPPSAPALAPYPSLAQMVQQPPPALPNFYRSLPAQPNVYVTAPQPQAEDIVSMRDARIRLEHAITARVNAVVPGDSSGRMGFQYNVAGLLHLGLRCQHLQAIEILAHYEPPGHESAAKWQAMCSDIYAELTAEPLFNAAPRVYSDLVPTVHPVAYLSDWPPFQTWLKHQTPAFQSDMQHPQYRAEYIQSFLQP
jgi:hypothetical protein